MHNTDIEKNILYVLHPISNQENAHTEKLFHSHCTGEN